MPEKNREYYFNKATDGISLLWLYHQDRVQSGRIPFVVNWWDTNLSAYVPSDLESDPLGNFNRGVFYSIRDSLLRLEDRLGVEHFKFDPRYKNEPINPLFLNRSVAQIFWDIRLLSQKHAVNDTRVEYQGGVLGETLEFGTDVITQLRAVCGNEFMPGDASLLSKISTKYTRESSRHIGLRLPLSSEEMDYELFVPGRSRQTNLDISKLKEWELDTALGCPAARPISADLRGYLRSSGMVVDGENSVVKGTMLTEYAKKIGQEFGVIDDWFLRLPEDHKQRLSVQVRNILDGTIWKERKAEILKLPIKD